MTHYQAADALDANVKRDVGEVHAWYDGLPELVKTRAITRHKTLMMVVEMQRSGLTRLLAVDQVSRLQGVSDRTIWNWLKMVDGVAESDWLCHLAPRNRSAERKDKKADCSPEFIDRLKGDYLRLERPSFASSYRRTVRWCRAKDTSRLLAVPALRIGAQFPALIVRQRFKRFLTGYGSMTKLWEVSRAKVILLEPCGAVTAPLI